MNEKLKSADVNNLFNAILALENIDECYELFEDLCTIAEIKEMAKRFKFDTIASGGVSTLDDVKALSEMNLYGAIVGKAYYIGAIDLKEAIEVAR